MHLYKLYKVIRSNHLILVIFGLLVGILAAYSSIGFHELISSVQFLTIGTSSGRITETLEALPIWQVLLVPAAGGLVVGLLTRYFMSTQRLHGIPEVIETAALKSKGIKLSDGVTAAGAAVISLGTGGSVGREGPVVHIGATIASVISSKLTLSRSTTLTLLGCGVAAAIAASFNAPIAGVFFALEVVVGHYALSAFSPVVIASVAGTIITRIHNGYFSDFSILSTEVISLTEIPTFLALGLFSAGAAILFIKLTGIINTLWTYTIIPLWIRPGLAGLALGSIALIMPEVIGVGYETTDLALTEMLPLGMLIALFFMKIFASALCLGSGIAGGIFSPSLFIGAMLGGAFGIIVSNIFPDLTSSQSAYAIAGMGAVAGAVLGAPISTILMVFELTDSYEMTILVMVSTTVSAVIMRQLNAKSYFHTILERRGIVIDKERQFAALKRLHAKDLVRFDTPKLFMDSSILEIKDL